MVLGFKSRLERDHAFSQLRNQLRNAGYTLYGHGFEAHAEKDGENIDIDAGGGINMETPSIVIEEVNEPLHGNFKLHGEYREGDVYDEEEDSKSELQYVVDSLSAEELQAFIFLNSVKG